MTLSANGLRNTQVIYNAIVHQRNQIHENAKLFTIKSSREKK